MIKQLLIPGCSAILLLAGCSSTGQTEQPQHAHLVSSQQLNQLQNKVWILTQLGDKRIKVEGDPQHLPQLKFEASGNRFSGSDGCNRLSGSYSIDATTLKLSQIASTKMMCMDGNQAVEQGFNAALGKVVRYQVKYDHLLLQDAKGATLLKLSSSVPNAK